MLLSPILLRCFKENPNHLCSLLLVNPTVQLIPLRKSPLSSEPSVSFHQLTTCCNLFCFPNVLISKASIHCWKPSRSTLGPSSPLYSGHNILSLRLVTAAAYSSRRFAEHPLSANGINDEVYHPLHFCRSPDHCFSVHAGTHHSQNLFSLLSFAFGDTQDHILEGQISLSLDLHHL